MEEPESAAPTGRIHLHEMAKSGQVDIVNALLDEGAKVDEESTFGETALFWAARGGHVSTIELLAKRGAKIDHQSHNGDTALHLAAFKGHLDACKVLVKLGAARTIVNKDGKRALDVSRSVPIKVFFLPSPTFAFVFKVVWQVVVAPEEDNADGYSGSESDEDF